VELPVCQSSSFNFISLPLLTADVDVYLGGVICCWCRCVYIAVIEQSHYGLIFSVRTRNHVLERHLPETRQLPRLTCVFPRNNPRPGASESDLFAVQENTFRSSSIAVTQCLLVRQVCRAQAIPGSCHHLVLLGR